jgi:hypothetical protein
VAWLLLAFFLSPRADAQAVCLKIQAEHKSESFRVTPGETLSISFKHSVYGSTVEERFLIGRSDLRANQLRYAELRLVEFYGHEAATHEAGWWVVRNPGSSIRTLDLRVSPASSMRIAFGNRAMTLGNNAQGHRARLSVSSCARGNDG